MSTRKITIKVDKEDLSEVLREINEDQIVSITLDLPDTKETYKRLSINDKILDWEFAEEELDEETKKDDKLEEYPEAHLPVFVDEVSKNVFEIICKNSNLYVGIECFIESTWRVSKKSPGLVFGAPLCMSSIREEMTVDSNPTVEKAILYKVIESYYSGHSIEEIVSDLIEKTKTKWKDLSKCETLTNVSILLFRNG